MIDIQSPTFIQDFKMSEATVGQVGYGFIGNAVVELFRNIAGSIFVYDKAGYDGKTKHERSAVVYTESMDDVVRAAEVIFVAVPTPMKPSGECHTGIVESVLQDIQNAAARLKRDMGSFVVVIKSTVPPGFTDRMRDKYALRILFSPEFLTEANAVQDFKRTNRVILGGDIEDARVVFKYFEGVWPDRQAETYDGHADGVVSIIQCDASVAEMVKLSTNVHLTARVMISNELYLICEKLGIKYDEVKVLTQLDRRIGISHMSVPGPDGHLGFSGSCFPKDIANLSHIANEMGNEDNVFRAIIRRNEQIRPEKDWEALKGRAVVADDK